MFNNLGIFASRQPKTVVRRILPLSFGGPGNDFFGTANFISGQGVQGFTGSTGFTGSIGFTGSAGTSSPVTVTEVTTSTYTALSTDYFICVLTNGTVTITLPPGILGSVYVIKDCFGNAINFPITIQGTGIETIDSNSSAIINTNFGSITVIFDGIEWKIV